MLAALNDTIAVALPPYTCSGAIQATVFTTTVRYATFGVKVLPLQPFKLQYLLLMLYVTQRFVVQVLPLLLTACGCSFFS